MITFSEESIGVSPHDLELGKAFLDTTPKAQARKRKTQINLPYSQLRTLMLQMIPKK